MNNFNDYYNYMIGKGGTTPKMDYNNQNLKMDYSNPTPKMNYNTMINFDNSTFQNTFMNTDNIPRLYSPNEGFTKGNMFVDLYDPYKDYKPVPITASSERQSKLQEIQMYKFAMNDLVLYLDAKPSNPNLIKLYNDYLTKTNELVNKYERAYGPLTNDGMVMPTNDWTWNNSPWPWEGEK